MWLNNPFVVTYARCFAFSLFHTFVLFLFNTLVVSNIRYLYFRCLAFWFSYVRCFAHLLSYIVLFFRPAFAVSLALSYYDNFVVDIIVLHLSCFASLLRCFTLSSFSHFSCFVVSCFAHSLCRTFVNLLSRTQAGGCSFSIACCSCYIMYSW